MTPASASTDAPAPYLLNENSAVLDLKNVSQDVGLPSYHDGSRINVIMWRQFIALNDTWHRKSASTVSINFHNEANFIRNKLARTHKYKPPNFESRADVISTKYRTSLLKAGIAYKNLVFNYDHLFSEIFSLRGIKVLSELFLITLFGSNVV